MKKSEADTETKGEDKKIVQRNDQADRFLELQHAKERYL